MASEAPTPDSEEFPTARGLRRDQRVGSGRYILKELLGQGGMGIVWLARDERLGEDLALKFLPQELRLDTSSLDDLRQETLKSRKLAHPNIIRIHDLFEAKGEDPFISMEYVDGPTLSARRSKQPARVMKWRDIAPLVAQLCEALEYAHNEQVIHRDLKPANLMLNSRQQIKLADFGIARVVTDSVSRITMRQGTSGTLVYMSPQQLDGHPSNPTDDIYSVGATLYELLASKPPFYTGEIAHQIRYVRADTISQRLEQLRVSSEVPPMVEDAVAACLEKNPSNRPQNARDLSERFGLSEKRPPSSRSRQRQAAPPPEDDTATIRKRRNNTPALIAAAVGVAALAVGGWWYNSRPVPAKTMPPAAPSIIAAPKPVVIAAPVEVVKPSPPPPAPAPTNALPVVVAPPLPKMPQAGHAWTNSIDMQFAPLPGTGVLLSLWETRVEDYEKFVSGAGYSEDSKWKKSNVKLSETHPVANVNFEDAKQFCFWLTRMEQGKGLIQSNQIYRLPADLEWSAAVGLENEQGRTPMERNEGVPRRYPWGATWPPPPGAGNFAGKEAGDMFIRGYEDSFVRAAPVGSFKPSKDGFYDLAGNVWEWCADFYDKNHDTMVLRGGAWDTSDNVELLSSHRDYMGPLYRRPNVGFRCVLDPGRGPN